MEKIAEPEELKNAFIKLAPNAYAPNEYYGIAQ
jgi:hypothetical protein